MTGDFAGKVAIVTGGASGIGLATCEAFARVSGNVVIADIDGEGANRVAQQLCQQGLSALSVPTDIGDADQIVQLVATAKSAFGGVDYVVNNAVRTDPGDGRVAEIGAELWHQLLSTNVVGPALLAAQAVPLMLERGGGAFVHLSSVAGLRGEDTRTCYGTAKAALLGLSRSLAVQYGKQGIRSNCIAPGLVLTPAAHSAFDPDLLKLLLDHHMTERLGTPEELAASILYLLSPAAGFITGQVLVMDGGFSAANPVVPAFRARSQSTL